MAKAGSLPKTIGPYAVVRALGKGGMGEVVLARHDLLERLVAIKRLAPREDTKLEEMEERFLREGRALATLHHQNIVGVHDLFVRRGTHYMVLEYVDGENVAQLLKKGVLPVDVAAIVATKVADALECAHRRGIVHRDIKGANVMVSHSGDVKLMDFGIARDEALDQVTSTGVVVGTPMYVAPEVIKGGDADPRSDIYALGALLYHALSGRRLFEHANSDNLYALIASGRFPKLSRVAPHVPWRLRRIVDRCLSKKPEKRFETAGELRAALELFLASANVWSNHEERLVGFLKARGHLTEEEASVWLSAESLVISATFEAPARSVYRRLVYAAVVAAAGGAAWWAGARGGWFDGLLTWLQAK